MVKHLTPKEKAAAADLYRQGWSLVRIGEKYGYTPKAVRRWLDLAGVSKRIPLPTRQKYARGHSTSKLTEKEIETAVRLYLEGQSFNSLGKLFGVDRETVERVVVRRGILLRPPPNWDGRRPLPSYYAQPGRGEADD